MNNEAPILDRRFVGREYVTANQEARAEDMIRYARATNENNPLYYDMDHVNNLLHPPLYPVVFLPDILRQLVDDAEEMNLDILRVVHAEQEMWWRKQIHPNEDIITHAKIVNIEQRGSNEILELHIRCNHDDTTAVEMQYRLLMRGRGRGSSDSPPQREESSHHPEIISRHSMKVAEDQGKRYAEASGDHNPIHISDEIAKSVGLPRAILHGLCTMAFASQAIVEELLDRDPTRLKYMSVRFSKPVLMGETLTTELFDMKTDKEGMCTVHFETKNPSGISVLTRGKAEFAT
ncbi:MAG: MaoC/PaaZ C-terminal domain-containing protein [Candidatus Thorarchaeota archaeon]